MCRVLGAAWDSLDGAKLVAELVILTYRAANNDILLKELTHNNKHCDGYGYLIIYGGNEGLRMRIEKFDAFNASGDNTGVCTLNLKALHEASERLAKIIKESEKGILILHARRLGGVNLVVLCMLTHI